jgi:RNA polymerase sigma factor (sigma-70 family)
MENADRSDDDPPEGGDPPDGQGPDEGPPSVEDPDEDIRDLIARGRIDRAFKMLMDRHGHALFRYCCTVMRNDAEADDVHQTTFIQAHRDLRSFAGRSTIRSWLFGIARHRILDARKRRKVEKNSRPLAETDELIPDPEPFDLSRLDDARLIPSLRACLDELPEETRTAVVLRYQQGFSFEELGDLYGCKPGTVQARVARALKTLARCIKRRTEGTRTQGNND